MIVRGNTRGGIAVLSLILLGTLAAAEEHGERRELMLREKNLAEKVERLKQEQDFLLFQKEFYVSDSKYLLLDVAAGTGQLKYRNRVLKSFPFTPSSATAVKAVRPGALVLTRKVGSDHSRLTLIFGKSLIIQSKKAAQRVRRKGDTPRLYLNKSDILSIFYALEVGARAYVKPYAVADKGPAR